MLAVRAVTSRRVPTVARLAPVRTIYQEGATAQSREFSKKEKAHEDQFVKQHELAQLKKLHDEINRKKAELADLEKEHAATLEKAKEDSK